LRHKGKLNRVMSFLALNKNDKRRQQNKKFWIKRLWEAELLSFLRKTIMRRYRGTRREAIDWIDYRRIHYIAASSFHPLPHDWNDMELVESGNSRRSNIIEFFKRLIMYWLTLSRYACQPCHCFKHQFRSVQCALVLSFCS
jgi:hypothetical protein